MTRIQHDSCDGLLTRIKVSLSYNKCVGLNLTYRPLLSVLCAMQIVFTPPVILRFGMANKVAIATKRGVKRIFVRICSLMREQKTRMGMLVRSELATSDATES